MPAFQEFPSPVCNKLEKLSETMNQLQQDIVNFSARLSNSRQAFKQSINDFFNKKPPFPIDQGTIAKDIAQYVKLVSYCLDAGDTEILEKWGIQAISSSPDKMLASNQYDLYYLAFNEARDESKTRLEEECWVEIIKLFQDLQNP